MDFLTGGHNLLERLEWVSNGREIVAHRLALWNPSKILYRRIIKTETKSRNMYVIQLNIALFIPVREKNTLRLVVPIWMKCNQHQRYSHLKAASTYLYGLSCRTLVYTVASQQLLITADPSLNHEKQFQIKARLRQPAVIYLSSVNGR